MTDPPKKLTFGFSKVVKKSNLVSHPQAVPEKPKDVQFIECLEANTIKLREGEEEKKDEAPLVIPIVGPRKSSTLPNGRSIAEVAEDFSDVGNNGTNNAPEAASDSLPANSLDAIAARELLQEGANALKEAPVPTLESLPSAEKEALQKESTLEDYENIPVNQFGLAMLRGMGWKPDEGIGKNKKLVPVTAPNVRPKGMGLGADKVLLASAKAAKASTNSKDEEELRMAKGAYVKILAGMNKNMYGQVEGFTDDSGRVLLKMAIGGRVISVNEGTVILVSKKEYSDNGRVLNAAKYQEYKRNEEAGLDPMKIKKETSPSDEKPRQQSTSSSKTSKSSNSKSGNFKKEKYREHSPKREKGSLSPRRRKEESTSRSRSKTPQKYVQKKPSSRGHRDRSISPSFRRKTSPTHGDKKKTSSARNRSQSSSPERNSRHQSPSSRRSRSHSRSVSREKSRYSEYKKKYDDSDSESKSRKKKKKKQKERKHSSSDDSSRSRSRSPKRRNKSKKHRKSRSRSPSSRTRR